MLNVGWSSREFTPGRPAMVHGQKYRRTTDEAMDPLTVTALALESDETGEAVVIVSCDLVAVSDPLLERIRTRVDDRVGGLSGERVIAAATHTHTSVAVVEGQYEHPGGDVMTVAECVDLVAARAVDAIESAWDGRRSQAVGRAFGHAVVGHNRYAVYDDGHAEMYGETDREDFVGIGGYQDHSVDMVFTWDPDGTLTGVALAIPCPSQVDEHLEKFSADFWHDVRVELRSRLGDHLRILPLCSAAGDQSPHFLLYGDEEAEMRDRRGRTERQEIACRVAGAVEDALAGTEPDLDRTTPLYHTANHLDLSPISISDADRERAGREYERFVEEGDRDSWWARRLQMVMNSDAANDGEPITVESHVIRLGELAIATNPFELFLDYGLRMKARSPAAQTLAVQLTCGRAGYLPTEAARERGGYGAIPASADVGPEGGGELVEETLAATRELF